MSKVNWQSLTDIDQLEALKKQSYEQPVLIFKHSTSCPISAMALRTLEQDWNPEQESETAIFFLDLLRHRSVSNAVAESFGVTHQSPQVIVLKEGKAVYDESHMGIRYEQLHSVVHA